MSKRFEEFGCQDVWWDEGLGNLRCGQYLLRTKSRAFCTSCLRKGVLDEWNEALKKGQDGEL